MKEGRRDYIRTLAARDFAEHELHEEGPGRWRCQKPGTWCMGFHVITAPWLVIVAGDIGDVIFEPSDRDATAWARRVRTDLDYTCGKIIASPEGRRPKTSCEAKTAAALAAFEEDPDPDEWHLWEDFLDGEDGDPTEFARFVESGLLDPEGRPDIDDWTSSALWAYHALTWWARAMDAKEAARG